jgi:adenylate cyclase
VRTGDSRRLHTTLNRGAVRSSALGLQKVDVLKGLHSQTLRAIAAQCKWTRYKPKQYVIRRDGADRDVYFVIAGMVRVTAEGWRGHRIIFRDISAGDLFGEHSAIDGRTRVADVEAVQESLLASMPPDAFRALLARHASVRERVLRRITGSVREMADQILDLGVKRVPGRIWGELLRIARLGPIENNTARINRPPSHREIANHVGTSREQVAREFSRMYREGLLAREGRAIVVSNIATLERRVADSRASQTKTPPGDEIPDARSIVVPRQRRAILAVDSLDAVAMMERDEERALKQWQAYLALATLETVPVHGGRSFSGTMGHGFVAEFQDSRDALACAFDLFDGLAKFNAKAGTRRLRIRIGIHLADILVEDFNIAGDGVNVAVGLAQLANHGDIIVSVHIRDQLTSGVDGSFEDIGEQRLRNRERSVRAFRVWSATKTTPLVASAVPNLHGRPSVAVIPFSVQSSDARFEFLGDGLADETIGSLSRVADFFVVSRLSSMAFRKTSRSLRNIGEMLGVQYVLSGSIHSISGQTVLVAELADTTSEQVLWSERFSIDVANVLVVQHELARRVVESVAPFVRSFELRRAGITNLDQLDAYGLTLRGIDLMHRMSREDFLSAKEILTTAISRDPTSPAPHAWLAKWHILRIAIGASEDPLHDRESATASAGRALECDGKDALALAVDGHAAAWARHDLNVSEQRLSQALASNPNEPLAWLWKGIGDAWRGRGAEAVESTDRALSLSPLDPMIYYFNSLASVANLIAARYERAIVLAQQSLRGNRFHTPSLRSLAAAQVLVGHLEEGRETVRVLRAIDPNLTLSTFRARYPGRDSPQFEIFSAALQAAGLPK